MMVVSSKGSNSQPHLVIVIAGPTAVGKSRIAQQLLSNMGDGVVISADSVQVYRNVEIGANKPPRGSTERQTTVLLDVVENSNMTYSAGDWRRDALYALEKVAQSDLAEESSSNEDDSTDPDVESADDAEAAKRRRQAKIRSNLSVARQQKKVDASSLAPPIFVGGTMMYLQWLVYGQPDAIQPTPEAVQTAQAMVSELEVSYSDETTAWSNVIAHTKVRLEDISQTFQSCEREALHAALDKLSDNDWYRLRRIMEVAHTHAGTENRATSTSTTLFDGTRNGGLLDEPNRYDVRCFFLCPADRMQHCHTMDERCEEMLLHPSGSGLIQETVRLLLDSDSGDASCIAPMVTKAIGYRQTLNYLRRPDPRPNDSAALEAYLADFCGATRRYAKKQMQWFRRDEHMYFVSVDDDTAVLATIQRLLRLPREDYQAELHSSTSASAKTRALNEAQGKGMKYYQFQPKRLQPGSPEFERLLQVADECTLTYQEHAAVSTSHLRDNNIMISDDWHLPSSSFHQAQNDDR